jgi:molybdate transport system substrate-binding protein
MGRGVKPGCGLAAALLAAGLWSAAHAAEPLVAAASDVQFALEEIADAYAKAGGGAVRLALGSSGNFARQIRQGAPFELFLSADEDYALALARDGFARGPGALYAQGRIALLVPLGSPLKPDGTLADLKAALRDGRVRKFAIADPEHAPYGRAAEQALRRAGLWEQIRPLLVLGENVSQAAQFAASGNAEGGIVAYSLALAPRLKERTGHALIPEDRHAPLRQRMVLLRNAGPAAERFFAYLQSPPARAIFRRHGFALPGEGG